MAKDQVKFTSPKNDGDREDNELTIHAEVVSFDLTSGAFDDIEASTVDFTVLDLHKLPPLIGSPRWRARWLKARASCSSWWSTGIPPRPEESAARRWM